MHTTNNTPAQPLRAEFARCRVVLGMLTSALPDEFFAGESYQSRPPQLLEFFRILEETAVALSRHATAMHSGLVEPEAVGLEDSERYRSTHRIRG